jgi:hypothetical protein
MDVKAVAACAGLCFCACAVARAEDGEQLYSVRGSVLYLHPGSSTAKLVPKETILLGDQDSATTGDGSLARIDFPDRSRVLVGADSTLQVVLSHEIAGTGARLSIENGVIRFAVKPSASGSVRYTFETPAASIGVPPGRGDIAVGQNDALQVNVYDLCDPRSPIEVRTTEGVVYQLLPGQSLLESRIGGVMHADVQPTSPQLVQAFLPSFGAPPGWTTSGEHVIEMQEPVPQNTPAGIPTPFGGINVPGPSFTPSIQTSPQTPAPRSAWCNS